MTTPVPQAPHRMLLVTFSFRGQLDAQKWEARFNRATDWYRYDARCWLLWTGGTTKTWFDYLKPYLETSDHMAIFDVTTSQMHAWLPKGALQWLQKYTSVVELNP